IRDFHVTGVQTCALPIYDVRRGEEVCTDKSFRIFQASGKLVDGNTGRIGSNHGGRWAAGFQLRENALLERKNFRCSFNYERSILRSLKICVPAEKTTALRQGLEQPLPGFFTCGLRRVYEQGLPAV